MIAPDPPNRNGRSGSARRDRARMLVTHRRLVRPTSFDDGDFGLIDSTACGGLRFSRSSLRPPWSSREWRARTFTTTPNTTIQNTTTARRHTLTRLTTWSTFRRWLESGRWARAIRPTTRCRFAQPRWQRSRLGPRSWLFWSTPAPRSESASPSRSDGLTSAFTAPRPVRRRSRAPRPWSIPPDHLTG